MLNYSQNGDCKYIHPEIQRYIIRHNYGGRGGQNQGGGFARPFEKTLWKKTKVPPKRQKKTILRERTLDFFLAEPMTCHV